MKRQHLLLLLTLLIVNKIKSQDKEDLYYAQPKGTGLYMGFVYLNEQNFILAGMRTLYLFNSQRLLTDSLRLETGGKNFLDNINHITRLDDSTVSVATLQRSMLLRIRDDRFAIQSDFFLPDRDKWLREYDLFIIVKGGMIARSSKGKEKGHFFY